MPDTPVPIEPDEVPDPVFAEAMRVYGLAYAESAGEEATVRELRALRAAVAVALTQARDQIAGWACGKRVLDNAEMAEVARQLDLGQDGDPGEVYLRYVRRMIGCWPGGYGG